MQNDYSERFNALCTKVAKDLVDRGLIVRAGCKVLLAMNLPEDRTEALRFAFFAGAEHLYGSLMAVMDADREVTERDLACVSKIHAELEEWRKIAMATVGVTPSGRA